MKQYQVMFVSFEEDYFFGTLFKFEDGLRKHVSTISADIDEANAYPVNCKLSKYFIPRAVFDDFGIEESSRLDLELKIDFILSEYRDRIIKDVKYKGACAIISLNLEKELETSK